MYDRTEDVTYNDESSGEYVWFQSSSYQLTDEERLQHEWIATSYVRQ